MRTWFWLYAQTLFFFIYFQTLNFLFCIWVELIDNVMSGEQERNSAIHIHVSILLKTPFPSRLARNTEQSSLCCIEGPCWLSISNIYAQTLEPGHCIRYYSVIIIYILTFLLFFFNVDHLKNLHWTCCNTAAVLCFGFFGCDACGILAPWPGIEPSPPALEGTTREVPNTYAQIFRLKLYVNTINGNIQEDNSPLPYVQSHLIFLL